MNEAQAARALDESLWGTKPRGWKPEVCVNDKWSSNALVFANRLPCVRVRGGGAESALRQASVES